MCVLNVVPRHPDHLVQLHDDLPSLACTEIEGPALLLSVCPRMSCQWEQDLRGGGADLPDRLILVGETGLSVSSLYI